MKKIGIFILLSVLSLSLCFFAGCSNVKVESIEFNKNSITLVKGSEDFQIFTNILNDDSKLIASVLPSNATDKSIEFSIDNASVAKIQNNKIIAVNEGVAHLTAKTKNGSFQTSVTIKVVAESVQLSKVQNLRIENSKLVWDSVENADYYTLSLNNANTGATILPEFSGFEVGVFNNAKVIAHSVGNAYLSSDESELYTFKQLNEPTNITNNEYNLSWTSVADATGYDVYVNSEKVNTSKVQTNSFTLDSSILSNTKSCVINIVALGENNIFDSDRNNNFILTKYTAPNIMELKQGLVMFNAVTNADSYIVKIDNTEYETNSTSFAVPEEVESGFHSAIVKTLSKKQGYVSSEYSQVSLNFNKLNSISNISLNNNTISWNSVENASGYLLKIDYSGANAYSKYIDVGTLSTFEFGDDYADGEYKVSVACTGSGTQFVKSNFSEELSLLKLETPQNFNITNGKVKFNAVENAKKYILNINGEEREIYPNQIGEENIFSIDVELTVGNYNIKVMAVGDNKNLLNSIYSNSIKTTKLEKPQQPFMQNGIIKWKDVNNSYGYNVSINDEIFVFNTLEIKSGYVQLDLSDEIYDKTLYSVKVQAVASQENISSDFSDASIFKKYAPIPKDEIRAYEGKLAFSYYENAEEYIISVDNTEKNVSVTDSRMEKDNDSQPLFYYYDLALTTYKESIAIKVKVKGNGEYISSCYSEPDEPFSMCKEISNLKIENNVLSFDKNNEGSVYTSYIASFGSSIVEKSKEELTNITSYNLPKFLDENILAGGKYTFIFKPQGDSEKTLNGIETTISATILSTPKTFEISDGLLSWSTDNNSSNYSLEILDDNKQIVRAPILCDTNSLDISEYTDLITDKKYYARIQLVGDGTQTVSSEYTSEDNLLQFIILSSPDSIMINDGNLTWNDVENASSYGIYIDDVLYKKYSKDKEILQNGIPSGSHSIRVIAYGDSNKYLNSAKSSVFEVVKLEAPDTVSIHKDIETNIVNFNSNIPAFADGIIVSHSDNNEEFVDDVYLLENNPNGVKIPLTGYESGYYSFKVKSVAYGDKNYLNSNETQVVSTTVMAAPKKNEISLEKGIITWKEIDGHDSYTLYIEYYADGELVEEYKEENLTVNKYTVPKEYGAGEYYVAVQAIGDDSKFITSIIGYKQKFTKLSTVKNLNSYNGEIIFNTLEGASSYAVYVDDEEVSQVTQTSDNIIDIYDDLYLTYELPQDVTSGNHTISIKAIGDDSEYLTGDICTGIDVYKLEAVEEFRIEAGIIKWAPITEALGYNIKVNNIRYENIYEEDTDYLIKKYYYDLINKTTNGNNSISVKAVGRKYQDRNILNSNYTKSIQAIKLSEVTNLNAYYSDNLEETGMISWEKVTNSSGYLVQITDINNHVTEITVQNEKCSVEADTIAAGIVKIKVRAIGNSSSGSTQSNDEESEESGETIVNLIEQETNNYLSGSYSTEKTFVKLDTPTDLRIEDGHLVWTSAYDSFIFNSIQEDEGKLDRVDENKKILDEDYNAGTYIIKVKAMGFKAKTNEDYDSLNSNFTLEFNATKPETPDIIIDREYGIIRWGTVSSAVSYTIETAFKPQSAIGEFDEDEPFTNSYNVTTDYYYLGLSGNYRFRIVSVSKEGLISDPTEITEFRLNGFIEGAGTEEDPYQIHSVEEFERMSHYKYGHFIQSVDLDFADTTLTLNPTFIDEEFEGVYDGDDKTIYNLSMRYISLSNLGLFANVGINGVVKNIYFSNIDLRFNSPYAGIVGTNKGKVLNVNIQSGTVSVVSDKFDGKVYAGGIVGKNNTTGTIELCSNAGSITAIISMTNTNTANCSIYAGGICAENDGTIYRCNTLSSAVVEGNTSGGICAINYGTIEASINNATVFATNKEFKTGSGNNNEHENAYAGGIVGENAYAGGYISNCINNGTIYCEDNPDVQTDEFKLYASGIAGINWSKTDRIYGLIYNCYNSVNIGYNSIDVEIYQTIGQLYSINLIAYNDTYGRISYIYYAGIGAAVTGTTSNVSYSYDVNSLTQEDIVAMLNIHAGDKYEYGIENNEIIIVPRGTNSGE